VRTYLHASGFYADQPFFVVITAPWRGLLSSLHYKHFADSVQSNVEKGPALRAYLVQEENISFTGSETQQNTLQPAVRKQSRVSGGAPSVYRGLYTSF